MSNVTLTPDEIREQARDWTKLFVAAAKAYDCGDHLQAANLALSLRSLLHDTKNQTSLLKLLEVKKEQLSFFDTPVSGSICKLQTERLRGFIPVSGLAIAEASYTPVYDPSDLPWSRVPFERWWDQDAVLDIYGVTLKRSQIVLEMADKERAHVDSKLTPSYAALRRQEVMRPTISGGGVSATPSHGRERSAVRQIAYEVQKTLAAELSNIFTGELWFPPPVYSYSGERGQPLGSTLMIKYDVAYLGRCLKAFEDSGEGDSEDARLIRSRIYWNGVRGAGG